MRLAVADAMRRSWTRPLASAGRPVFMDPLIKHRQHSPHRPGITLYFARALALALAENPECAGYLVGENILSPRAIDIGIAVQVADGVMVPVLRRVNERTMEELLEDYNGDRPGAPQKAGPGRQHGGHRHCHQLRRLRPDLRRSHAHAQRIHHSGRRRRDQDPGMER